MSFGPITTERLLLRPPRPTDAAALAARRSEPAVAALQSWAAPYPLERAEELLAAVSAMDGPRDDEWWMLTIVDPDDTEIHGDLAIHPTWGGRSIEIGYTLAPAAWGRGYAVEAVDALVERLFEDPALTRLHAMTHPDNVASAQVLERTGFRYEGRTRLSYWVGDDNSDDVLYGMTRADWLDWRHRPRGAPATVELTELTSANADAVRRLVTHTSQERFVSPVAVSYGDAMFPLVVDGAPLVPAMRAIVADGEPVGFVLLALMTAAHPEPRLWRILVDRRHQRRGIGERAVALAIDELRFLGASAIRLSWTEGRGSAEPLYRRLGFEPTGEVHDGAVEARLALR